MAHFNFIRLFLLFFLAEMNFIYGFEYVKKEFLLETFQKMETFQDRVPVDFEHQLPYERSFLRSTRGVNYTDLFNPTVKDDPDVMAYNILNQRSGDHRRSDKSHELFHECKEVYIKHGLEVFSKKLGHVFPRLPKEIQKDPQVYFFSYCVGRDIRADQESLLYYFHGASGNPSNFNYRKSLSEVRRVWRNKGKLPLWASISVGKLGSLLEKEKEKLFFEYIVPYVEKRLGVYQKIKQRFGMGVSLGGGNVNHIVLKKPEFFKAAFLVCPAISVLKYNADHERIKRFVQDTSAYYLVLRAALALTPDPLKHMSYYYQVDPLYLGQKNLGPQTPPLYIQTSSKDEFGFDVGGKVYAMLAKTKGVQVQFEELEGRHCVLRPKTIVEFFKSHI
jgi:hypothetical protein